MIKVKVVGENGKALKVNGEGEVSVTVHQHPPESDTNIFPFRQYFTNNGKSSGSNNMAVVGTLANPIDFYITANPKTETWIKSVHIKLSDAGANFSEFGALTALTNGVELVWNSQSAGDKVIHDGIKDNLEFFRLSEQTPNIVDLSGGGADAVVVTIDFASVFGTPYGIKLNKGTLDSLIFRIRDNIGTGITQFNVIGYGIQI